MTDNDFLAKKIKRLSQALAVSGILNIGVLSLLSYWIIRERPPTPYFELKPAIHEMVLVDHRCCAEVIGQFHKLSFDQLVNKLTEIRLIENGYTERDLALSSLVSFHHFNLSRALAGDEQPKQQRTLLWKNKSIEKSIPLIVYPGLSDSQFDSIVTFVKTERWPLTTEGMFYVLQKQKSDQQLNEELINTFMMMPEFLAVELLFNRSEVSLEKKQVFELILEGNWKLLSSFFNQQKLSQDLSSARRQRLLLDYLQHGSKKAAYLLLITDRDFAVKKLDDRQVLTILEKLTIKTDTSQSFAMDMLTSPRGTEVWQQASSRLYGFAGETVPAAWNYQAVLTRFAPTQLPPTISISSLPDLPIAKQIPPKTMSRPPAVVSRPIVAVVRQPEVIYRTYVVQEGDSLWKISRMNQVDLEALKKLNKLQSDALKVGLVLKLPPQKNK